MGPMDSQPTKSSAIEIVRHQIKYEPRDNFPEVVCECLFLSNSRLFDCTEKDTLLWRREGHSWIVDEHDEEFGQYTTNSSNEEVTMTMVSGGNETKSNAVQNGAQCTMQRLTRVVLLVCFSCQFQF